MMNKSNLKAFLISAVIISAVTLSSINCYGPGTMQGSIGINISDQPGWGPEGYDRADYYYIPDIDSYYSVREHEYIYRDGSGWIHSASLPSRYSGYDPYHSYKVVVDEDRPYEHHDSHQAKYGTYRGVKNQPVIRDSHDAKYFENKDHPEHEKWVKEHKQ